MDVRVGAMCGSLRAGSYNRMLMNEAISRTPEGMVIEEIPIHEIPPYNEDLVSDAYPAAAASAKSAIRASDCLLLVTPEYDYGVPGVLKNAVDWMSRPHVDTALVGKPLALMGASTGYLGTARAQLAWRTLWHYNDGPIFSGAELYVTHAADTFSKDGRLGAPFGERLDRYLAKLNEWILGLRCESPYHPAS